MKRILLTLCVLIIALVTIDNVAAYYKCVDREGNTIIGDNPEPNAKCEEVGGGGESYRENEPTNRRTGISRRDEMKLKDLYDKAIGKSEEKGRTVGGAAGYLCLAEVISAVKSSGKSVNPKFLDSADDIIRGYKNYTVGGLLNAVQRAASIQSINTSNIAPCNTAMLHSY